MTKYYIIGGQDSTHCYGHAHTLARAKKIAEKHIVYDTTWQDYFVPSIYCGMDTTAAHGIHGTAVAPNPGAIPAATRLYGMAWA